MTPDENFDLASLPAGKAALTFAQLLAAGDYQTAYQMLTPKARNQLSPESLQSDYTAMYAYVEAPTAATRVHLEDVAEAADQTEGKVWSYVSVIGPYPSGKLAGATWVEGFGMSLVPLEAEWLIDEIIWGRP